MATISELIDNAHSMLLQCDLQIDRINHKDVCVKRFDLSAEEVERLDELEACRERIFSQIVKLRCIRRRHANLEI